MSVLSKYHHTTKTKEHCTQCDRPFLMLWKDKEETSGQSETKWRNNICTQCVTKNKGRPPLTLSDHNSIAINRLTKEQCYKQHGY